MGKQPVRMKAVIYTLSPYQQKVMPDLWHDFAGKIQHKIDALWLKGVFLFGPVIATYWYAQNYVEKEKLAHKY